MRGRLLQAVDAAGGQAGGRLRAVCKEGGGGGGAPWREEIASTHFEKGETGRGDMAATARGKARRGEARQPCCANKCLGLIPGSSALAVKP